MGIVVVYRKQSILTCSFPRHPESCFYKFLACYFVPLTFPHTVRPFRINHLVDYLPVIHIIPVTLDNRSNMCFETRKQKFFVPLAFCRISLINHPVAVLINKKPIGYLSVPHKGVETKSHLVIPRKIPYSVGICEIKSAFRRLYLHRLHDVFRNQQIVMSFKHLSVHTR